jgi:hypothetical protein
MRSTLVISCLLFLFCSTNIAFTQTEIKLKEGSFDCFYKWGDGYIGSVQFNKLMDIPKKRVFHYYSNTGNDQWNKTIEPKSNWNELLVHEEGEYAFWVDIANVATGGIWKRKYPSNLMVVYRLDKSGNMETFNLNHEDNFATALGSDMNGISLEYLGATKTGLIGILAQSATKKGWNNKYILFRMDEEGKVIVKELDYTLTETEWYSFNKSMPVCIIENDQLLLAQISKDAPLKVNFNFRLLDPVTLEEKSNVNNKVTLKSGFFYGGFIAKKYESTQNRRVIAQYFISPHGDSYYTKYTLGAFFKFHFSGEKVIAVGNNFMLEARGTVRENELRNLFIFEVDLTKDKTIGEKDVKYYDLHKGGKIGKIKNYAVQIGNGKINYTVRYKKDALFFTDGEMRTDVSATHYWSDINLFGFTGNFNQLEGVYPFFVQEYKNSIVVIDRTSLDNRIDGTRELELFVIQK